MKKNISKPADAEGTVMNASGVSSKKAKEAGVVKKIVTGGAAGLFLGTVGMAAGEAADETAAGEGSVRTMGGGGQLDDMSFANAFSEARAQLGPGQEFEWHGGRYSTYTEAEWNEAHPSDPVEQAEDNPEADTSAGEGEIAVEEVTSDDDSVEILGVEEQIADGSEVEVEIVTGSDISGEDASFVNLESEDICVDPEEPEVTDAMEDVFVGDVADDAVIM